MRHLLSFFIILSIFFTACNQSKQTRENQAVSDEKTQNLPETTTPLFIVTGFGSSWENMDLDSLKTLFCEGKVYVLESSRPLAEQFFACKNAKILKKWQDFLPLAKDNFLITDITQLQPQFKALAVNEVSFFENSEKYPFQLFDKGQKPFPYQREVTQIMLTGVTAITRQTAQIVEIKGIKHLTKNIRQYFQDADFVHISNEVSFMDDCATFGAGLRFCSKPEYFAALKDLKANIIELTGNHNRDFGNEPFVKTFQWYQEQGMQTFGGGLTPEQANTPLIITLKDGSTVGFIGFNELCPLGECAKNIDEPGANAYEEQKAKAIIEKMRNTLKVDFIIVSVQFGEIDSYLPTARQVIITKKLIDFGADIVYGSQAHQVQIVEFYKGKIIFQGFGNFMFDQTHKEGLRQGFFLKTYFYRGKMIQAFPIFTFTADDHCPAIATKEQAQKIREAIFRDEFLYSTSL